MKQIEAMQQHTDFLENAFIVGMILLLGFMIVMAILQTWYERRQRICNVPNSVKYAKAEGTKHNNHIQSGEKTGRLQPVRSSSIDFSHHSRTHGDIVPCCTDKAKHGGLVRESESADFIHRL